ncbi:hypothetical protein [Nocardia lasii]|uniref:PPE domain-containing protein n=1 Tax=Nocardia lasii TaxID=1616107 RepID=A0ABW1JUB3_9NOCA
MSDDELSPELTGMLFPGLDPSVTRAIVAANQQQSGSEKQQKHVGHDGTDPAYITAMEAFEGLSHVDIYAKVQQMQPGVMQQFGDQWLNISTEISGAAAGLTLQTMQASADLEGAMADAAAAAGKRFLTEIADVHEVVSTVGHRVKAAAFGAEVVRKTVPAPVGDTPNIVADSTIPPSVAVLLDAASPGATSSAEQQKEELRLQAVAAMNSGYKPTFRPAGENVPTFVAPTVPGEGGDPSAASPGGSGAGGGSGRSEQSSDDQVRTRAQQDKAPQDETIDDEQSPTAATDSGNSSTNPTTSEPSTSDPSNTAPASTMPAMNAAAPSGTSPGIGSAGSGATGPGTGAPGSGTPAVGAPVPGRSVAGTPVAASATQAGAGGSANGRSMSPGMMPPPGARGGKRSEDEEHQAPEYLRGFHRELLGDEEATVPQTLGADTPAAAPEEGRDR